MTDPSLPDSLEALLIPPTRDLGDGFTVRRALPSAQRRMVGPFIFFDQMGPALLTPGHGLDVRPHPHIGLSTVTYLFDGVILHRDSLGVVQPIHPGAVNWMTAGRGIVHSERTPPDVRAQGSSLFGIQIWVALPLADELCAPSFVHHPAESLPQLEGEGRTVRLIVGELFGACAPVATRSKMVYADVRLEPGAHVAFPPVVEERGLFIVEGPVEIDGVTFEAGQLVILKPKHTLEVLGPKGAPSRVMLFGGDPLEGPRHIFWNFVSSSRERLQEAKNNWRQGRFAKVPEETEFIPLPEDPTPVRYP